MIIILNSIQETVNIVLFLQNTSTLLLEIYLNDLFLKKVMVIGLILYSQ